MLSLIKFLIGLVLGGLLSFVPNASPMLISISLSSLLDQEGVLGSFLSSILLRSFVEATSPELSGDPMLVLTYQESPFLSFSALSISEELLKIKRNAILVGLPLGIAAGIFNLPLLAPSGVSLGSIIIVSFILFYVFWLKDDEIDFSLWKQVLVFVGMTTIWTVMSSVLSIPYPILTLGICLFVIPQSIPSLRGESQSNVENEKDKLDDYEGRIKWTGLVFNFVTASAGVNFNVVNTALNYGVNRIHNYFFFGTLIEFIALGRISFNQAGSGITHIGSELSYANIFFILAGLILSFVFIYYKEDQLSSLSTWYIENSQFLKKLGAIVSILSIFILAGFFAPILITVGILLHKNIRSIPSELKGLMYLPLIII